eukprot:TRINITY_DN28497_c0_g2_i2.p1 TRINITY_DN28497_c0_g2~~TRINITY_DN28497_c0_g2_i2.p1  ORF type:complete len:224 (+),score=36.40 TRINITY_DN28497_c0_g2_i2:657-1328(+)
MVDQNIVTQSTTALARRTAAMRTIQQQQAQESTHAERSHEEIVKKEDMEEMMVKMQKAKFDLNDFLQQYQIMTKMGGMQGMMKLMPGMSGVSEKQLSETDRRFRKYSQIIDVMTDEEKSSPELIARSPSKRRRIARESKHTEKDITELITLFTQMRIQLKTMSKMFQIGGQEAQAKSGISDEQMMEELLQGAMKPVKEGKIRRRKDRDRFKIQVDSSKAKGFA